MTSSRPASASGAPPSSEPYRVVGLDGLRAIAVVLVIVFHLGPGALVGGYLGVDVFFVVSGFLITTLLVREREATGRIRLGAFWLRRARRLLPALVVLVLVCCTAAWGIGGDLLVGLGRQLIGAASFSMNWLLIADGSTYFGQGMPELFRNLWSLAVEEQFYLIWPLLLAIVLLRIPRWLRIAVALLLAGGSAVAMALLLDPADGTRVYYGTDTHAFGLAIGAALAFAAVHWPTARAAWPRAVRLLLPVAGLLAIAALIGLAVVLDGDGTTAYRGGLVLVSVLTAIAIGALLLPGSWIGRVLETGPFRWVGRRSYGLYLWHWPVLLLAQNALPTWQRDGWQGWAIGGAAAAITVIAAALSYRFIEQPVRRFRFRRAPGAPARPRWRVPVWSAAVAVVVLVTGAGSALALGADPGVGQTQRQVEAGQQAIRDQSVSPAPDTSSNPHPGRGGSGTGSAPAPTPSASPLGGDQITAIGDSVMLAAAPELQAELPGISIDAVVSRQMSAAPALVQQQRDAGTLRAVVLVELGTNGPIQRSALEQLHQIVGPDRQIIVVSAQAPRGWTDGVNATLSAFAQQYRNVVLANWHDAVQPHLAELNRDQIHFGGAGARLFTSVVKDALQQLAELPPSRDERDDLSLPIPV
jgi:peptidoglycan/LPS O-acetylase OafA/YrhL